MRGRKTLVLMCTIAVWSLFATMSPPLAAQSDTAAVAASSSSWHDVKHYGAKGDGSSDDAAAIAAAAHGIPRSGGVLYLPPGDYVIRTTIVLRSGVSLRGAGMGVSRIIQAAGANLSSLVSYSAASFVTVSDLTLDGNKTANTVRIDGLLNFDNSSDVVVRNCEFKDTVGHATVGVALRFARVNKRILLDGNYV